MHGEVTLEVEKFKKRKKRFKFAVKALVILSVFMTILYLVASLIYNGYNFTISLDPNLYYENNIIIYDHSDYKVYRQQLWADALEKVDNISEEWIDKEVDLKEGSHNGENYMAYTFFIENTGKDTVDYYVYYLIDDVVKSLDEAIRIKVYYDGEPTTYAKLSSRGVAEEGTIPFENDNRVFLQKINNFGPSQIHKYTIVVWLEGNDLECTDNILGGEFKSHMEIKSEFVEE